MRIIIYFLLVSVIISCGSSVPKNVLQPDKMQAVLWDVMQADELAEYNAMKDSSFSNITKHVAYYQDVLASHKISKEDFTRSLNYYENHPELLKNVLDSLQRFGERLQQKSENKKAQPLHDLDTTVKRNDSIKRKGPVSRQK